MIKTGGPDASAIVRRASTMVGVLNEYRDRIIRPEMKETNMGFWKIVLAIIVADTIGWFCAGVLASIGVV